MLAGLFRSNRPAVLLILPLVVLGVFLPLTWSVPSANAGGGMPLMAALRHVIGHAPVIQGIFSMAIITLLGAQLALLANDAELLGRRTHLPALLLPALLGAWGPLPPLDPALVGMPFVVLALHRSLSIALGGNVLSALFDSGLLLGIAAMFYVPYAFLIVVVWASVSVIRPFHWREYVLPLVGCCVIFLLAWGALDLLDLTPWHPLHTVMLRNDLTATSHPLPRRHSLLLMAVLVPLVMVALVRYAQTYQRGIMREKNLRASFMSFLAGVGVVILLVRALTGSFPPILAATPLAVFCGHALVGSRRAWLGELAVTAMLVLALIVQWKP